MHPKTAKLFPHYSVVCIEKRAPPRVAQGHGMFRRPHDVGEQHGREDAVDIVAHKVEAHHLIRKEDLNDAVGLLNGLLPTITT